MTDLTAPEGDRYEPVTATRADLRPAGRSPSPGPALYDADDEAQDGPASEPDTLRDLIVAQGMQETGIFVLLFTSESAGAMPEPDRVGADTDEADTDEAAQGEADWDADQDRADDPAAVVRRKAEELGVDTDRLTLFSDDAYLLQAALGEAVAAEPA